MGSIGFVILLEAWRIDRSNNLFVLPAGWRVVKKPDSAKAETKAHTPKGTKIESGKIGTGAVTMSIANG